MELKTNLAVLAVLVILVSHRVTAEKNHIIVSFEDLENDQVVGNGYKGLRWGDLHAGRPNTTTSVKPAGGKNFAYTPYPPSSRAIVGAASANRSITLKGFAYACTLGRFLGPTHQPPAPLPPIDYGARSVECEINVDGLFCAGQGDSALTIVDLGGAYTSKNVTFMASYSGLENAVRRCSAYLFRVTRFTKNEQAQKPILLLDNLSIIFED